MKVIREGLDGFRSYWEAPHWMYLGDLFGEIQRMTLWFVLGPDSV